MATIKIEHTDRMEISFESKGLKADRIDLLVIAMTEHPTFLGHVLDAIEMLPDQITMQNSPALDSLAKAAGRYKRALKKEQ